MTRPSEFRTLGEGELREKLQELRDELFRLRFRAASDPDANPSRMRLLRRDIARVRTVQRARERGRTRSGEERSSE